MKGGQGMESFGYQGNQVCVSAQNELKTDWFLKSLQLQMAILQMHIFIMRLCVSFPHIWKTIEIKFKYFYVKLLCNFSFWNQEKEKEKAVRKKAAFSFMIPSETLVVQGGLWK